MFQVELGRVIESCLIFSALILVSNIASSMLLRHVVFKEHTLLHGYRKSETNKDQYHKHFHAI